MTALRSIFVLSLQIVLVACSGSSDDAGGVTSSDVQKAKNTCLERAKSDTCAVCGCNTCLDSITRCYADTSCETIVECGRAKGCRGVACYDDKTCKAEIDGVGGPTSPAAIKAQAVSQCTSTKCTDTCATP